MIFNPKKLWAILVFVLTPASIYSVVSIWDIMKKHVEMFDSSIEDYLDAGSFDYVNIMGEIDFKINQISDTIIIIQKINWPSAVQVLGTQDCMDISEPICEPGVDNLSPKFFIYDKYDEGYNIYEWRFDNYLKKALMNWDRNVLEISSQIGLKANRSHHSLYTRALISDGKVKYDTISGGDLLPITVNIDNGAIPVDTQDLNLR